MRLARQTHKELLRAAQGWPQNIPVEWDLAMLPSYIGVSARIMNHFLLRNLVAGIYGREFASIVSRPYPPSEMTAYHVPRGALETCTQSCVHGVQQQRGCPRDFVRAPCYQTRPFSWLERGSLGSARRVGWATSMALQSE